MQISLNWLKQYIELDLPVSQIAEILTDIGLEVEAVEHVESIKGGLKDLIVGEVITCVHHENADKLKVCEVNIGENENLSIVCGAPNVAAGQKVVVAPVNTEIHPTEGEPFTIKKAKIRGVESFGMLAAEDEIGLGTNHDGIMVLPPETKVGTPLTALYPIKEDVIFEIGLTPNRSDAQSHLGVARDLAAAIQTQLKKNTRVQWPDISDFLVEEEVDNIDVVIENKEACPRYAGVVVSDIEIKESPEWLKERLNAIGVNPINNVVDVTNFINHEYGQPLHAFDYDQIKGKEIIVKNVAAGTKFTTLDGVERSLHDEDLMICNSKEAMAIGGVYGGKDSGVSDETSSIFIESAYFEPRGIRRTELRHNLKTDAASKFEKGVDPTKQVEVLKRAAVLIKGLTGGKISSKVIDVYPQPLERKEVDLSFEYLNRLTGVDFEPEIVVEILRKLDFEILAKTETRLRVAVPLYRNDVTRPADVVEEVLRIYGFNNVPLSNQTHFALSYDENREDSLKNKLSELLSANNFYEIITNSITKKSYYDVLDSFDQDSFVMPINSLNAELDLMRPNMLMTGLEVIIHNINHSLPNGKYYDFGKIYQNQKGIFNQNSRLALYLTGVAKEKNWLGNKEPFTFFDAKRSVLQILKKAGLENLKETEANNELLEYGINISHMKQEIAYIGKVSKKALDMLNIKQEVFYADIDFDYLLSQETETSFRSISKFPSIERDLALVIDKSVSYKSIENIAIQNGGKFFQEISLFDVFESKEKLGEDKKSYAVRLRFTNPEMTLTNQEVDVLMKKLISQYENQLNALIRS